jgi:hypothetical protein
LLENCQSSSSKIRAEHESNDAIDDLDVLHTTLRGQSTEDLYDSAEEEDLEDFSHRHHEVETLFEEEESLLNLHMSVIQENAELLTEEGKLLQSVQSEAVIDHDIDNYAHRLGSILDRKLYLISCLREKLSSFRTQLEREEVPGY